MKNSFVDVIREVFITIQLYFNQDVVRKTIDLDKWSYSSEKISALNLKDRAEQQEVLRISLSSFIGHIGFTVSLKLCLNL